LVRSANYFNSIGPNMAIVDRKHQPASRIAPPVRGAQKAKTPRRYLSGIAPKSANREEFDLVDDVSTFGV
jgi:hypothetical protein